MRVKIRLEPNTSWPHRPVWVARCPNCGPHCILNHWPRWDWVGAVRTSNYHMRNFHA